MSDETLKDIRARVMRLGNRVHEINRIAGQYPEHSEKRRLWREHAENIWNERKALVADLNEYEQAAVLA